MLHDGGEGVTWRGARSQFIVRLYDKSREMHVPGSVLRAEISLRGEQLRRRLQEEDWRDLGVLYRLYRDILVTIPPIPKPVEADNWQEAIGAEPLEIRQRIMARLAHKPDRTLRRHRQRIEAAAANLAEEFSWAKILPPDSPPPAANVLPSRLLVGFNTPDELASKSGFALDVRQH